MSENEVMWEYGFESPQRGLMYVTANEMLVETLLAAKPDAVLYRRPLTEWEQISTYQEDE